MKDVIGEGEQRGVGGMVSPEAVLVGGEQMVGSEVGVQLLGNDALSDLCNGSQDRNGSVTTEVIRFRGLFFHQFLLS